VISTTERTISAGFLNLGVPESFINIPANSTWLQSAFCPGGTWLFTNLTIFGNIFHMQFVFTM
jgi:hypothetical protein